MLKRLFNKLSVVLSCLVNGHDWPEEPSEMSTSELVPTIFGNLHLLFQKGNLVCQRCSKVAKVYRTVDPINSSANSWQLLFPELEEKMNELATF